MPIKEIMALAATIMGAIFITHPLSFEATIHRLERSMLRELSRTDNWGDPSIYHGNRYMQAPRGIHSNVH
jgi:hypothetical protein